MTVPKPSDLAHRRLQSARQHTGRVSPAVEQVRAEFDYFMSDMLGPDWRNQLDPEEAILAADVMFSHILEEVEP